MRNVLIAGKTDKICESISELLSDSAENFKAVCVTDGIHARCTNIREFDTIIISTPLSDEFGLDLAAELYGKTGAGLIVITKGELAEEVQSKLKFTNAFVLGRPTSRSALLQAVKFAEIAGENIKRLTEENKRLEQKIEDMQIISRAKLCLVRYLKLTEEQAHRHIQKQAMDLRITQRQAAEDILLIYEVD